MLKIIKEKEFSKLKGHEVQRVGKKTTLESRKGEKFRAVFYQWIRYTSSKGKVTKLRSAAMVTVVVIREEPFTIEVTSSNSQVMENGEFKSGPPKGTLFKHRPSKK